MPIYICYRGDCDHLALQQQHELPVFVVQDALGRSWLCIQTRLQQIPTEVPPKETQEIVIAQGVAHRLGFSSEGTSVNYLDCPDAASLGRHLLRDPYPPAFESMSRLIRGGWTPGFCTHGPGKPFVLTISKGSKTISVQGETEQETCFRAAEKALGEGLELQETAIMPQTIHADPVPLRIDVHDAIRVGESRVTLDLIVREYQDGANPEDIHRNYPTVGLADVYAAIAYYLRHKEQVDEYLKVRRAEADRLRREIEATQPAHLRAKLLARQAEMEEEHASSSL